LRVVFLRAPVDRFDDERFRGTFAPFSRASESPIAIACLRLVTFRPLRPLFSVPDFRLCIARLTLFPAALPYLRPPELFFLVAIGRILLEKVAEELRELDVAQRAFQRTA
jgi:hypothetical protein